MHRKIKNVSYAKKMKFAILIPNLGISDSLFVCLDSIVNQIKSDSFEFDITLLDQSDMQTYLVIKNQIETRYQNRVLLKHSDVRSVTIARHNLLQTSQCDYFWFVDSDDYLEPDALATIFNTLRLNDFPDILAIEYDKVDSNNCFISTSNHSMINKNNFLDYFLYTDKLNDVWSKVFKRSLYHKSDYDNFSNRNGEDFVMCLPLFKRAKQIIYCNDLIKYHYRLTNDSRTKNIDYKMYCDIIGEFRNGVNYEKLSRFQNAILLENRISFFVHTSFSLINSNICKKQYFDYCSILNKFIDKIKPTNTKKLSFQNKVIYLLLRRKHYNIISVLVKKRLRKQ